MLRQLPVIAVTLGLISAAAAQNVDAIAARQEIYKGFGKATKPIGPMLKGDSPFDASAVKEALTAYSAGAKKLPALFPDDSKTGHDTEALPAIWSNKDDFNARLTKLASDSEAAMANVTDEASFKATMPKIVGQCGACHKEYRAKK